MDNIEVKKLANSEVEITGDISADKFESYYLSVIKEFNEETVVDGFRKGRAPEKMIVEKIGEDKILFEMAEHALSDAYPDILKANKIDAIGRPEITITKVARNNPLGFKIKTAVMPEIKLADYKKIAKKEMAKPEEAITVEDNEIDNVIEELRKEKAKQAANLNAEASAKEELPEVNDDFVKSLGGDFSSVADLRAKIKENIEYDRRYRAKEKRRLAIIDQIIADSQMDVPEILVHSEIHKMGHEMRAQIEQMGLKYEDYLAHIKKTEEDLHKEWHEEAEKRVKFSIVMSKIATAEEVKATKEEIDHETGHILEHYQDANPDRVKAYVEDMIINEKVFKFLEEQK